MNAQVSLEYLIIFAFLISSILIFIPVYSKLEKAGEKIILKNKISNICFKIQEACEKSIFFGVSSLNYSFNQELNVSASNGNLCCDSFCIHSRCNFSSFLIKKGIISFRNGVPNN
ncbi:MAG: hypothetical protein QW097_01725 [archaeon]